MFCHVKLFNSLFGARRKCWGGLIDTMGNGDVQGRHADKAYRDDIGDWSVTEGGQG